MVIYTAGTFMRAHLIFIRAATVSWWQPSYAGQTYVAFDSVFFHFDEALSASNKPEANSSYAVLVNPDLETSMQFNLTFKTLLMHLIMNNSVFIYLTIYFF